MPDITIDLETYNRLCEDNQRMREALQGCVRALSSRIGTESLADHFPLKLEQARAALTEKG